MDTINMIITVSAFLVSILYAIGFQIIVSSLSQRGVEEFQLLNVRYLSVGMNFIFTHLACFALGMLVSSFVQYFAYFGFVSYSFLGFLMALVSLIAIVVFVARVSKSSRKIVRLKTKREISTNFYSYVALSTIGSLFPAYILVLSIFNELSRQFSADFFPLGLSGPDLDFLYILTAFLWAMFLVSQMIYYSQYYYGQPNPLSTVDPSGIGIPVTVQFLFDAEKTKLLTRIGIPIVDPGLTGKLQLIETTNDNYIVSVHPDEDSKGLTNQTVKLSKNIILGVVFHKD